MADDADTDESRDDVIVHGRGTIEAYINNVNMISLRQTDAHDEHCVILDRHDVPLVVERLRELAETLEAMSGERREESVRAQQPRCR
jgi:hypothetical protein